MWSNPFLNHSFAFALGDNYGWIKIFFGLLASNLPCLKPPRSKIFLIFVNIKKKLLILWVRRSQKQLKVFHLEGGKHMDSQAK